VSLKDKGYALALQLLISLATVACESETRAIYPDTSSDATSGTVTSAQSDAASTSNHTQDKSDADAPPEDIEAAFAVPKRVHAGFAVFDPIVPDASGFLRVAFDLPEKTLSFVITVDPDERACVVELRELCGPGGEILFDATNSGSRFTPASARSKSAWFPFSVMVPSAPDLSVQAGRYEARFWVQESEGPVSVDVVWKRQPRESARHTLSIALWFAAGATLDATSASGDDAFVNALDIAASILGEAAVELDPIVFRDLTTDPALRDVEDEKSWRELTDAITAMQSALNLIVVERLELDGEKVRGRCSNIPTPPPLADRTRAGSIIIALESLPTAIDRAAELIAHEIAHALGLRHTSEADGIKHDPISDTPECPASRATLMTDRGAFFLRAEDCDDLDGDNLLFYTPYDDDSPQRLITPGQSAIMLANPSVRATP
jgi:hypothetical protein